MNSFDNSDIFDLSDEELKSAILSKMEELRKVSHRDVSDSHLRCAAKFALGIDKLSQNGKDNVS